MRPRVVRSISDSLGLRISIAGGAVNRSSSAHTGWDGPGAARRTQAGTDPEGPRGGGAARGEEDWRSQIGHRWTIDEIVHIFNAC